MSTTVDHNYGKPQASGLPPLLAVPLVGSVRITIRDQDSNIVGQTTTTPQGEWRNSVQLEDGIYSVEFSGRFRPIGTGFRTSFTQPLKLTSRLIAIPLGTNIIDTISIENGPTGMEGPTGPEGPSGEDGSPGPTGTTGETGPEGPMGPQGAQGIDGESVIGPQGPAGVGSQGSIGPAGVQGVQGPQGAVGLGGSTGPEGITGVPGTPGSTGPGGNTGVPGTPGSTGPGGNTGVPGTPGPTGPGGNTGVPGTPGPTGPGGNTGVPGTPGPTGPEGNTGAPGLIGVSGVQGIPGRIGASGVVGIPGPNSGTAKNYASITLTADTDNQTLEFNPFDEDSFSYFSSTGISSGIVYDSTDGSFTVDESGVYELGATYIIFSSASALTRSQIKVNGGSVYDHHWDIVATDVTERTTRILHSLTSGDIVTFTLEDTTGSGISVNDGTTAVIALVTNLMSSAEGYISVEVTSDRAFHDAGERNAFDEDNYTSAEFTSTTHAANGITYNSTTGRFTVATSGTYVLNYQQATRPGSPGGETRHRIYINDDVGGSPLYTSSDLEREASGETLQDNFIIVQDLAANDFVVFTYEGINGTSKTMAGTVVNIYKIAAGPAGPVGATGVVGATGPSTTDHGSLTGLTDDDHLQYAKLAGRSGGQILSGGTAAGENLKLLPSSSISSGGTITLGTGDGARFDTMVQSALDGAPTVDNMILSNTAALHLQLSSFTIGKTTVLGFNVNTVGSLGAAIAHERRGGESVGKLHFATKEEPGDTGPTVHMTIDQAGNVGIGTLNPTELLHLQGETGASIFIDGSTGVDGIIFPDRTRQTTAADVLGPASSTDNAITRFDGTSGKVLQNSSAIITDAGWMGIGGPTSPAAAMEILRNDGTAQLRLTDTVATNFTDMRTNTVGEFYITASAGKVGILKGTTNLLNAFFSFRNVTDEDTYVDLAAGSSADQRNYIRWRDFGQNLIFSMGKSGNVQFIIFATGHQHAMVITPGGITDIASAGSSAVVINGQTLDPNSGTGGLIVKGGGAVPQDTLLEINNTECIINKPLNMGATGVINYTAATPTDWIAPSPTGVFSALDELAARTQFTFAFHRKNPVNGESYINSSIPDSVTLTNVWHEISGGTSVTFNLNWRNDNDPFTTISGEDVWISDKTANPTNTEETSFDNATSGAGKVLAVEIGTVTGSPTDLVIYGYGTYD